MTAKARPAAQTVTEVRSAGAKALEGLQRSKTTTGSQVPQSVVRRSTTGHEFGISTLIRSRFDLPLYLVLLMLAKAPDVQGAHTVQFRTGVLAEFLGMPDYNERSSRLVTESLKRLHARGAIDLTRPPGEGAPLVRLVDWERFDKDTRLRPNYVRPEREYLTLPTDFWRSGWHVGLSSRALAMLLVSLDRDAWVNGYPDEASAASSADLISLSRKPFWLNPSRASELYGMSADTRGRGWRELVAHGVLLVEHQPVNNDSTANRIRNHYTLNRARLRTPPRVLANG